jgi:guanylate kinase
VHGNLYGTGRGELRRAATARAILFDIDHQGARQIKAAVPDVVTVFILPPNPETLLLRLRGRASEDEATVQRRFRTAREEIAHYGLFDYVLVNDDLDEATEQLASIFRAEECRRSRMAPKAEGLLAAERDFGVASQSDDG